MRTLMVAALILLIGITAISVATHSPEPIAYIQPMDTHVQSIPLCCGHFEPQPVYTSVQS